MSSNDKTANKIATYIQDVFFYMAKNHLNIRNEEDVAKTIKIFGKEKITKEGVKVFIPMLEILERMVKAEIANLHKSTKTA